MKILKDIILVSTLLLASCVGKVEPSSDNKITIEVNKPQISVDKGESVKIKIKNWGEDISDQADIYCSFNDEKKLLENTDFIATESGEYTFSASVDGIEIPEDITIRAYNDSELGATYFQRHLVKKFTATWCVNCPEMGNIITELEHELPFEIIEMAIHSKDEIEVSEGSRLVDDFNYMFLPTVVVDMDWDNEITKKSKESISNALNSSKWSPSSIPGIRINTSIKDNNLNIEVGVTTTADGNYKIAVAAVADNYHFKQTGASSSNYKQNKVLRTYYTDPYGDKLQGLNIGSEKVLNYDVNMPTGLKGDCRIIAYIIKEIEGKDRVINSNECLAGEAINYIYSLK